MMESKVNVLENQENWLEFQTRLSDLVTRELGIKSLVKKINSVNQTKDYDDWFSMESSSNNVLSINILVNNERGSKNYQISFSDIQINSDDERISDMIVNNINNLSFDNKVGERIDRNKCLYDKFDDEMVIEMFKNLGRALNNNLISNQLDIKSFYNLTELK